ncbi:MAG: hypothetical protein ABH824_01605 [Nanoarchaeota archaeon]|nr:hypothetical protein [Nanoarchaeota archaeon]MBU1632719.1 hypothetical protein [Nanoarchaeota archaeon]MBU1876264.1 hypothetical protein [Nanoarchaeota archaeon]
MIKQLKRAAKDLRIKEIITKWLDKIELDGPLAGKLLDSKIHLYEMKTANPPLRLYYKYNETTNEIYVFEFEMKTNPKKQKETIGKLRHKSRFI